MNTIADPLMSSGSDNTVRIPSMPMQEDPDRRIEQWHPMCGGPRQGHVIEEANKCDLVGFLIYIKASHEMLEFGR